MGADREKLWRNRDAILIFGGAFDCVIESSSRDHKYRVVGCRRLRLNVERMFVKARLDAPLMLQERHH